MCFIFITHIVENKTKYLYAFHIVQQGVHTVLRLDSLVNLEQFGSSCKGIDG